MTERISDVYLITMLLVFPLFFGFSGYAEITLSKFVFLLAATGLDLAALIAAALLRRAVLPKLRPVHFAALAIALVSLLSWICSGDLPRAFLGAGRYDGLLSTMVYLLGFLSVSLFSRPKRMHAQALALSVSLCLLIALIQLGGGNPLGLYPRGLTFFDHGIRYSGSYLGTIGNTNILDAVLCLALPLFAGQYIAGARKEFLVPLALAVPVLCQAGGDGAYLALLAAALLSPIALVSDPERLRRALRCAALCCCTAALACWWQPEPGASLRFAPAPAAWVLLSAAAVCAPLSFLPLPRGLPRPAPRTLRSIFAALAAAGGIAALCVVLLRPGESGTLYELNRLLHGQAEDSFGSSRIGIWRACLALAAARPLLGYGPGMLAAHLDIQYARYIPETGETLRSFADNAHNVYLAALVNTGAVGLLALLVFLALAAVEGLRRRDDPLRLSLLLGLGCAAIHALFGLGLCLSEPLVWLAMGLLCAESQTN